MISIEQSAIQVVNVIPLYPFAIFQLMAGMRKPSCCRMTLKHGLEETSGELQKSLIRCFVTPSSGFASRDFCPI
ncbi:hypothetical protein BDU57DRAFT_521756 [Ampelomyces quisqualis]|uniref:Uncharacterized protein n=1 Tax=Ampelomyces quisqualis TaxID=50730 RepID=A0A6A5QDW9_AMPQU|nr:hypothetical protein BDU57DRAFT_521756 [Ampelomyces quisqualis]